MSNGRAVTSTVTEWVQPAKLTLNLRVSPQWPVPGTTAGPCCTEVPATFEETSNHSGAKPNRASPDSVGKKFLVQQETKSRFGRAAKRESALCCHGGIAAGTLLDILCLSKVWHCPQVWLSFNAYHFYFFMSQASEEFHWDGVLVVGS